MPGPPPKPPARRQRRNTPSLNLVVPPGDAPDEPRKKPAASTEWLACTRDDWNDVWADNVMAAIYNPGTDLQPLYRLFGLRDDRERFRRAVRRKPLVDGSKGQPVTNPLAKLIPSLDRDILALEDRFGLSPKARLMLGVTLARAGASLDELAGGLFDNEPAGDEEEDPRTATVDARSRPTQS